MVRYATGLTRPHQRRSAFPLPTASIFSMTSLRHSVSQWCFSMIPLPELVRAVRSMGIESVELLEPQDWAAVRQEGLPCALARGPDPITDSFYRRENHDRLVPAFQQRCDNAPPPESPTSFASPAIAAAKATRKASRFARKASGSS